MIFRSCSISKASIFFSIRSFMSLNSTLQKLPQLIQKLTSLTSTDPSTSGKSDNDKAEVQDWLSKVAEGSIVKSSGFKVRDIILLQLII